MNEPSLNENTAKSLRYGRLAGRIMGVLLLGWGLRVLLSVQSATTFDCIQSLYFVVFGILVQLPYSTLRDRAWKISFATLCLLSAGFVFVMVVSVMFSYMEYAERGEKLGVPGLEGTLVFLALLQPPVVLFQRKPDLLD